MIMFSQLNPLAAAALFGLLKIVCVLAAVLFLFAYATLAERRVSAFIQDRLGPNRVGPFGIWQPVADGIKAMLKEDFTPAHVRKLYFWLAPMITMAPAFMVMAIIPFGSYLGAQKMVIADLNIGILYTFGIVSLGVYGIVLAGYASRSKYPFMGGLRSGAQMISYEIAMGMAVVPVFMLAADPAAQQAIAQRGAWGRFVQGMGDLNLNWIVAYQAHGLWMVLKQPLSFVIFLAAAFAETNRLPFDLPESETELVGGYHTEYSSMKFALFFMGEYANVIAASAMMVTLFFGGWTLPAFGLDQPASSVGMGAAQIGVFLAKVAVLIFLFIWVRWMWPRFRYDQLMNLGWKRFVPLALANIVVTALVLWARH